MGNLGSHLVEEAETFDKQTIVTESNILVMTHPTPFFLQTEYYLLLKLNVHTGVQNTVSV